jgi:hypothetical protein
MKGRSSQLSVVRQAACIVAALCAHGAAAYDWLQFNGDPAHGGNNVLEKSLSRANVATLAQKYQITLPAVADGAPVFLRGVVTPSGKKDLLFLTTKAGHIVALNAATGASAWSHQNGAGGCTINNVGGACFTTSSPAIDPNRAYVYSYGLDGYVHKYAVGDGTEILSGGWPQQATLKGYDEKGSAALSFAAANGTTYLYVVHGGYPGDNGDYQGHVTAIDLATGAQKVFNAMCSDKAVHFAHLDANCPSSTRSAVWARPGVIYDAGTGRIFIGTGNGSYNGSTGGHNWSESVLALAPDATGAGGLPLDAYTPTNFQSLDNGDTDLGSSAPAILPVPATSTVAHLALQTGKDGKLRLINLANMSGAASPGHVGGELGIINLPQGGGVVSQPAVWVNPADNVTWAYIGNGGGTGSAHLQFDFAGNPSLVSGWSNGSSATSPVVANNVLYVASGGTLRARDPLTGAQLWSGSIGGLHWESPVVHNGMLYMSDESAHLTAFAPASAPAASGFDLNLNRRADLVWENATLGQTAAWLMNGVTATTSSVIFTSPDWSVTNTGDFDGDGRADLVWRNAATSQTAMWLMNGTSTTASAILPASATMSVVAVGDLDGDGKADLVWRDASSGNTVVWLMNGTSPRSAQVIWSDANWRVTHTGDFNGDGKSDLVWRNTLTGQTAIWLMAGALPLSSAIVSSDPNWSVARVADLDGDGKSDLVWQNSATGATAAWLMGGVSASATAVLNNTPGWSVTQAADLDGDGKADLVWRNASTGAIAVWVMNGLVASSAAVVLADPNWRVAHVGDFDGDGKADIAWTNVADGRSAVWLMNGAVATQTAVVLADPQWRPVDLQ